MPSNATNLFLTKFRMPSESPKLGSSPSAIFSTAGISTVFCPRIKQKEQLTYSDFRKSWSSQQEKLDTSI